MIGWHKKVTETPVTIPPSTKITSGWITLETWTRAEAEALKLIGPGSLYGHIGWDQEEPFPTDVKTQWLRSSDDGLTQRQSHAVGTTKKAASGIGGPEYLSLEDFPMAFQVWCSGSAIVVRKVITVVDAPDSRIAAKVSP